MLRLEGLVIEMGTGHGKMFHRAIVKKRIIRQVKKSKKVTTFLLTTNKNRMFTFTTTNLKRYLLSRLLEICLVTCCLGY